VTKAGTIDTNSQKYRTLKMEMDGMSRNSTITEREDDKHGENGCATEAVRSDVKATKRDNPWLNSLLVFCADVSVVGLRYVANASSSAFRRTVWVVLILWGVAFTAFQIHDRIRYFFSYPVNVIIREEYSDELRFPTVTICNENRASLSKMTALGIAVCIAMSLNCYTVHKKGKSFVPVLTLEKMLSYRITVRQLCISLVLKC